MVVKNLMKKSDARGTANAMRKEARDMYMKGADIVSKNRNNYDAISRGNVKSGRNLQAKSQKIKKEAEKIEKGIKKGKVLKK